MMGGLRVLLLFSGWAVYTGPSKVSFQQLEFQGSFQWCSDICFGSFCLILYAFHGADTNLCLRYLEIAVFHTHFIVRESNILYMMFFTYFKMDLIHRKFIGVNYIGCLLPVACNVSLLRALMAT